MPRKLVLIIAVSTALVIGLSLLSTLCDLPWTAAHAQGPFGRKQGSDDAERRKQEEEKRQEEAKQQEETRKQEEARKREEARRREEEARRLEETRRQEEASREEERRRTEEARREEERRREAEAARNRVPDATPTYRREDSRRDNSEFERVGERAEKRRHRHTYRPEYYPYDPPYVVIVEELPVVIVSPQPPAVVVEPVPLDIDTQAPVIPPVDPSESAGEVIEMAAPAPSTPDESLTLIRRAWIERKPELISPLLPENDPIRVLREGDFSRELSPAEFLSITSEAIQSLTTEVFWLKSAKKDGDRVTATGVHTYRAAEGPIRRSDISYTLELRGGRWVIAETGFTPAVADTGKTDAVPMLNEDEAMRLAMQAIPAAVMWILPERAFGLVGTIAGPP